jgi:hypothetical protein
LLIVAGAKSETFAQHARQPYVLFGEPGYFSKCI